MSDQKLPPLSQFRRVVTGINKAGEDSVLLDAVAENRKFPDSHVSSTLMWSTTSTPTSFLGEEDEGARILGSAPPAGGTRFTMMEFQPGNEVHGLHRTDTVDYVICISGEIDMFLDKTNFVKLKAGDVLIQRGTYHAWANRGTDVCRLAVVLVDATPKREGSVSGTLTAR